MWLSHDLSWAKQIDAMCRNACKQIGILYRQFYGHSSPDCLRQLYISLVRLKLEYAAPVWDPHPQTSIHKLEKVQKFALEVCTKLWTRDYDSLYIRYSYYGPICRTNAFANSFFPHAISKWNDLPLQLQENTSFKRNVFCYLQ